MAATISKKEMNKIKKRRRFIAMFFVALLPSLFIMIKGTMINDAPWYLDIVNVTLISLVFSISMGVLATMKFSRLKKNRTSFFILGGGIFISALFHFVTNALFYECFIVFTVFAAVAAIQRKENIDAYFE